MTDKKKPRRIKNQPESLREITVRKEQEPVKKRRVTKVAGAARKPFSAASKAGKKEIHLFKLPDNKLGRFLGKRVRFLPKYITNSWNEIKQVAWPNARETTKMTFAVVVFALVIGGLVWVLDYGLNKVFREVLLG